MNKNRLWTLRQYIRYRLLSRHKRGHGIHSPTVYEFVTNVLKNKIEKEKAIVNLRKEKELRKSGMGIHIDDPGIGSTVSKKNYRTIGNIAKHSSTHFKYRCLIGKIIDYYQPQTIVELGTSLGLTADIIRQFAPKSARVITVEGSKAIFKTAEKNIETWQCNNIEMVNDYFSNFLQNISPINTTTLVYIDGHHKGTATIQYFNEILRKIPANSIIILGDIYWSKDMTEAWQSISEVQKNRLAVDLFYLGIVFKHPNCSGGKFYIKY